MCKCLQIALASVAITNAMAASSGAEVLYRETFGRITTGNQSLGNWDWALFNAAGGNGGNAVNGGDPGRPIDVANTPSAGPASDGTFNAYEDGWSFLDGSDRLAMTPEFPFDPGTYSNQLKFSWWQGNTSPDLGHFRVVVKQGGAWYASAQEFINTAPVTGGANFGTMPPGAGGAELMEFTYNPAAANWITLTFDGDYTLGPTPGSGTFVAGTVALAEGPAPGATLSGTITHFGLYRSTTFNNSRFDTFTIESTGPPPIPGDTDGDGVVELEDDFGPIRDNFRKSGRTRTQGDLTGGGVVDFEDFRQWKGAFLGGGGTLADVDLGFLTNVPEPSAFVLASVSLAGIAGLRRGFQRPDVLRIT